MHVLDNLVANIFKIVFLLILQRFRLSGGHSETFSTNSGTISSRSWPGVYSGSLNCDYTVTGSLPLVLTFDTIRLTKSSQTLTVKNGQGTLLANYGGVGTYSSETLNIGSNKFVVDFTTSGLAANEGWTATWTSLACDESFSGESGSLTSLNYPSDYPNSVTCTYIIDAGNTIVSLAFESFDTQSAGDIMEVYNNSVTLMETMSGQLGAFAVFPSNYYKLEFTANSATTGQGFSASWQASRLASVSRSAYGACLNVGFDRVASTELSVQPFEKNRNVDKSSCSTMCASMSQCVAFVAEQDTCVWFKTGLATSSTDFVYKKR